MIFLVCGLCAITVARCDSGAISTEFYARTARSLCWPWHLETRSTTKILCRTEFVALLGGGASAGGWSALGEIAGGLIGGTAGVLFGEVRARLTIRPGPATCGRRPACSPEIVWRKPLSCLEPFSSNGADLVDQIIAPISSGHSRMPNAQIPNTQSKMWARNQNIVKMMTRTM